MNRLRIQRGRHRPAFAYGYGEAGISVPRPAGLKGSSRFRVKNSLVWSCASERSVDPAITEFTRDVRRRYQLWQDRQRTLRGMPFFIDVESRSEKIVERDKIPSMKTTPVAKAATVKALILIHHQGSSAFEPGYGGTGGHG